MTHTIILEEFGRNYGQGVLEVPVALQSAISNAALDGFYKNFSNNFKITKEDIGDNYGYILGSVLDIEDIPVSFLATVNCTLGSIGPNEDLESKFFNNTLGNLNTETFIIRGYEEDDNLNVVKALIKACDILGYPALYYDSGSMKRKADSLKLKTIEIGQKIEKFGNQLSLTNSSEKKLKLLKV